MVLHVLIVHSIQGELDTIRCSIVKSNLLLSFLINGVVLAPDKYYVETSSSASLSTKSRL